MFKSHYLNRLNYAVSVCFLEYSYGNKKYCLETFDNSTSIGYLDVIQVMHSMLENEESEISIKESIRDYIHTHYDLYLLFDPYTYNFGQMLAVKDIVNLAYKASKCVR